MGMLDFGGTRKHFNLLNIKYDIKDFRLGMPKSNTTLYNV